MKPTFEQEQAISIADSGKSFKMSAYAGTGKTSTLKLIGNTLHHKTGLYLAFNKAIATEAASKFSKNVECKTFHSMAYRQSPRHITEKLSNPRLMPSTIASMFNLSNYKLPLNVDSSRRVNCTPNDQAMILNRALGSFCRSTSSHITHDIVLNAMPNWIDKKSSYDLVSSLVTHANTLWHMSVDHQSQIKISHDVYLKHWSMQNPIIESDFVLFDEAQDADPIMLQVLNNQNAQVIFVGDKHQSIYGFRGAVNAMQSLSLTETRLTKSFRFGGEVADTANAVLSKLLDEKTPLVGNPEIQSKVCRTDKADAYLARTNAGAFSMVLDLCASGRKPKLQIDIKELADQISDAENLQKGVEAQSKSSDFFGFDSWSMVLDYTNQFPMCDISPVVNLIEKNGTTFLKSVLDQAEKNNFHDCIVSTAHKSKGLEFNSVKLASDFEWEKKPAIGQKLMSEDDARLFYVACTRAINTLDTSEMSSFFYALARTK